MQCCSGRAGEPAVVGTTFAPHTGDVLLDALLRADGMFVNAAVYGPGARTYWHAHASGQLIVVDSGRGVVATRSGDVRVVQAGDIVHAPAGEEHWHGAAPDCFVTYRSISLGDTETYGEVDEKSYAAVWR